MSEQSRWAECERLYHAALELEPAARAAFIERECAGDDGMRREVESLLAHESSGDGFLDSPAMEVAPRDVAEPGAIEPGTQFGAYKIIEQIGRGGMGIVYRAVASRADANLRLLARFLKQRIEPIS